MAIEYNYLGKSGIKVSNMCLGGNTFGQKPSFVKDTRPGNLDEEATHILLDRFAELGGNFIDTADLYSEGDSERFIGSWLAKQDRKKFIISTKVGSPTSQDHNGRGLSRKHVRESVEQSLERLQTDYIDLYYIHLWDVRTSIEETLCTLSDLVRQGKINNIGISNVLGWQLQKAVDVTKQRGLTPIVALQAEYNMLDRGIEFELTDVCENEGISVLPYGPLKYGWLSGKIQPGMTSPPEGSRVAWSSEQKSKANLHTNPTFSEFATDRTWKILEQINNVTKQTGKTHAQVALRWLLQRNCVTSLVFGAKTLQQLEANMAASSGWKLDEEQMKALTTVSETETLYPYTFKHMLKMLRQ